jgi:hypothetical protein
MTKLNDSTFQFVRRTLNVSRLGLLRSNVRLHCQSHEHGMQAVTDAYPNKEVLLACGCRRLAHIRTRSEVTAFEEATKEAQRRRRVNFGKNAGSQWTKIYVEDVEEVAA